MKNQNISLASKVALVGLFIITIAFCYACYNSVQKTKALCELTLGTQN